MTFKTVKQKKIRLKRVCIICGLIIANITVWLPPAKAQTSSEANHGQSKPDYEFAPVTINAYGNPLTASYERLQRGVEAFKANANLAPSAPLKFWVFEQKKDDNIFILRLELDEEHWLPIETDDRGDFVLPVITGPQVKTGKIVVNRKNGFAQIDPWIRTYGLEKGTQRLGDLRLMCAVRWAIYGEDAPLALRVMIAFTNGPCNNRSIRIYVDLHTTNLSKGIFLQEGNRKMEITEDGIRKGFVIPLHDLS